MVFRELFADDAEGIKAMSEMATEIVREHYDSIIGKEQNDYMLSLFQTEDAIREQLTHGYRYFFIRKDEENIGFIAFFPRGDAMYISKFYLYKSARRQGYSRAMMAFAIEEAKKAGLSGIELNVNKNNNAIQAYEHLGMRVIRSEKNDIGNGFYMDDYVYRLDF